MVGAGGGYECRLYPTEEHFFGFVNDADVSSFIYRQSVG